MEILFIGFIFGTISGAVFGNTISAIFGAIICSYYVVPVLKRILYPSAESAKIEILNEQFEDL